MAYQKKVCPPTTISTSQVFISHLRNRGNKELSEQSNCSVLQGIKVGSSEEHNQYIIIPQRVSSQYTLSKLYYQALRKLGILQQISTFPGNIYILNKHPRQSWSKDCSLAAYKHSKESLPPQFNTSPGESNPVPQESWNSSPQAVSLPPVDSGAYPRRARTRPPALVKKLFPYQDITGLSSAKIHGNIVLDEVFLSPAKSINTSNTTRVSPASNYQQLSKVSLSPQSIAPQQDY